MMDTEITRYDCYGAAGMLPHTVGDFVLHKDYAALLAEAERQRWQPIESAPKDGGQFLALGFDYGYENGARHYACAWWLEERGRFVEGASDSPSEAGTLLYLTHWMPLPPPPAPRQATGEEGA